MGNASGNSAFEPKEIKNFFRENITWAALWYLLGTNPLVAKVHLSKSKVTDNYEG